MIRRSAVVAVVFAGALLIVGCGASGVQKAVDQTRGPIVEARIATAQAAIVNDVLALAAGNSVEQATLVGDTRNLVTALTDPSVSEAEKLAQIKQALTALQGVCPACDSLVLAAQE